VIRARGAALLLLLLAPAAQAATPTVAVMPFQDLSGGRGAVGEAIRETVTTDLKEVRGLTVIERGAIDKVLAEQALQARRADLDPSSTVKIGKLLGASLIVTGAYQRGGATVRLTARFVRVETGEIVGTAKVDGAETTFLQLQDRVTAALLRSAGLDAGQVRKVTERPRPKLRSLRAVELYGEAVQESDDEKRSAILRQAIDEDAGFTYATKDLEALERRMKGYAAQADAAQVKAARELREQIAAEKDPVRRAQLQVQAMGALVSARRYRQLEADARPILAAPAPPPAPDNLRIDELAGFYLLTAEGALKERDALLRDGELFLKRFPASVYYKAVEAMVRAAIDERRREEEGKAKAPAEAAALSSAQRWDLCQVGHVYQRAHQHREAQRLFRACVVAGTSDRASAIHSLVMADIEMADWPAARRDLRLFDGEKADRVTPLRQGLEMGIPTDG
jgi:TolB-like protein